MPSPELAYKAKTQSSSAAQRVMPQNIDAEKAVLGAMLFSSDIADDALAKLSPEEFYRPSHRKIFEAMLDLNVKGIPVDSVSVVDRLEARGELETVGGKPYIIELGANSYALDNWSSHADIIHRESVLRDLITASVRITSLGYDAPDDLDEVVEESERLLFDVTNRRVESSFRKIGDLTAEAYNELTVLANQQQDYVGVRTGYVDLDNLIGGLRGGTLTILGARPSVGKTSLALNIATRAARLGTSVAFFSLEMSSQELIRRIFSTEAHISSRKLSNGRMSAQDWTQLLKVGGILSDLPFWIDESPSPSMIELRTKARRVMRGVKPGEGIIFIDYLQLMQSGSRHYENRTIEISEISRGMKMLAKELDIPIVALSQLSRGVEQREDKRPLLSDLRESGSIEQDADIVMFLDRSKDEFEAQKDNRPDLGKADVYVAKNRNGETGKVTLTFQGDFTRFDNYAPESIAADYSEY